MVRTPKLTVPLDVSHAQAHELRSQAPTHVQSRYSDESPGAPPSTGGLQPPATQTALVLDESLLRGFETNDLWDPMVNFGDFFSSNTYDWQDTNPIQADFINPDILEFLGIELPAQNEYTDFLLP